VFEGSLYIVFPYSIQTANANKILRASKLPGCDKAKLNKIVTAYSFYRNKNQALKGLQEIASKVHVANYDQIVTELNTDVKYRTFVGK
jgi:endonuclease III-like uncharacterized protein